MPPIEHLVELRIAVKRAECREADRAAGRIDVCLDDLRAQTLGELLEAIDRIDAGLGSRLLLAMYPKANAMHDMFERRKAA